MEVGLDNKSILYRIVIGDTILWQILDIVIMWWGASVAFPGWKGFNTVKWYNFLNLPDCFWCSFIYLFPLIHINDGYLSKNVIWLIFCKITNSHPYNTVSVLWWLVQKYCDNYSFYHLSCSHPSECTTSRQSQPTWSIIINIDRYETSLSW